MCVCVCVCCVCCVCVVSVCVFFGGGKGAAPAYGGSGRAVEGSPSATAPKAVNSVPADGPKNTTATGCAARNASNSPRSPAGSTVYGRLSLLVADDAISAAVAVEPVKATAIPARKSLIVGQPVTPGGWWRERDG